MNKLTKSQRHKYYKEALKRIKSGKDDFMCNALEELTAELCDRYNFPELFKKKPACVVGGRSVWFYKSEVKSPKAERIKILKACIEETKPKQTMENKKNKR